MARAASSNTSVVYCHWVVNMSTVRMAWCQASRTRIWSTGLSLKHAEEEEEEWGGKFERSGSPFCRHGPHLPAMLVMIHKGWLLSFLLEAGPSGMRDTVYSSLWDSTKAQPTSSYHKSLPYYICTYYNQQGLLSGLDSRLVLGDTEIKAVYDNVAHWGSVLWDRWVGWDSCIHVPFKAAGVGYIWADAKGICVACKVGHYVSMVHTLVTASDEIKFIHSFLLLFRSHQGVHYAWKGW